MFGLQMLDVAIGLIFIYLLLSLVCTASNELIAGLLNSRAKNLSRAIQNLLKDNGFPDLEKSFYQHPLVKSLYIPATKPSFVSENFYARSLTRRFFENQARPSYIPPKTFALAILDIVAPGNPGGAKSIDDVRTKVGELGNDSDLGKVFQILLDQSGSDVKTLTDNVETWFNEAMERAAGWYKRKTQLVIIPLSFAIVIVANADTIQITKAISNNPSLRQALVAEAQELAKAESLPEPSAAPREQIEKNKAKLEELGVPLGWDSRPEGFGAWVQKIFGLLLTALAVSLGAPFWFDLLKKVINIRATGLAPGEKNEPPKK